MADDHFRRYTDPYSNHLRAMLPISREADVLIRRVLCVNPWRRISLAQLKKEIMGVKTFFLTDVEIALATDRVRTSAASQQLPWVPRPHESAGGHEYGGDDEQHEQESPSSESESSYSRSSGVHHHHRLVVINPTLFTVSLSSDDGSTDDSRSQELPATPVMVPLVMADIPVECTPAEEELPDEVELVNVRPALGMRRSTKSIKQGASRKFQAVITRLRGF